MKIKAFEDVDRPRLRQYKACGGYWYLNFIYNKEAQELRYSRSGNKGFTLEQAQQMLKVLGIELYEEKEINTFEEFGSWLSDNNLFYDGTNTSLPIGEKKELYKIKEYYSIYEIEKEYNVKLNILRNE